MLLKLVTNRRAWPNGQFFFRAKIGYSVKIPMTRTVKFDGRPIWAEVSLGALVQNFRAIRRHVNPEAASGKRSPRRMVLAVIKSNAYGHGIVPVARALSRARADWFGVTCSAEGAELRASGIREPVLILTGFWAGEEQRILENNLTPAVMRPEQLRLLEKAAAKARKPRRGPVGFHLKIDSGMNRLGIQPSEIPAFARVLADCPHLRLAGTFTHIASSEVFSTEQTIEQEKAFMAALACMKSLQLDPGIVHMANSAAIVSRPSSWYDMVRPGAVLYGYHQFFEPSALNPEMEAKLPVRLRVLMKRRERPVAREHSPAPIPCQRRPCPPSPYVRDRLLAAARLSAYPHSRRDDSRRRQRDSTGSEMCDASHGSPEKF